MQEVVDRYRNRNTRSGFGLRVDDKNGELVIWYMHWGELNGVDAHHHMGIARIRKQGNKYAVGWFRGEDPMEYKTDHYASEAALYQALDQEIENR